MGYKLKTNNNIVIMFINYLNISKYNKTYMSNKKVQIGQLKANVKRLLKDVVDITKNPLHTHGIHYFHNESNFNMGSAIIFGPKDSIYENGVYFFEFKFPEDYPFSPPTVTFLTNDGVTRFNPNLYRNGKVCLSILNTWRGEQWTSCQNIRSVLLTLITLFHNKPLLNEPGIKETHRDFNNYNKIIRYRNYETAILRVAVKKLLPGPAFERAFDIIKEHFLKNKYCILNKLSNLMVKKNETVICGTYNMRCFINYDKLYYDMELALSELK